MDWAGLCREGHAPRIRPHKTCGCPCIATSRDAIEPATTAERTRHANRPAHAQPRAAHAYRPRTDPDRLPVADGLHTNSIDRGLLRNNAGLIANGASGFGVPAILTTVAEKILLRPDVQ